jgi:hypothetical protein
MENYKSNSDKLRMEEKIEPVVNGSAKVRKRNELQKAADAFVTEDIHNVKTYVVSEVIIPAVKKAISDIVVTGIDMLLYGGSGRATRTNTASRVSYRNYFDPSPERVRANTNNRRDVFEYDDILFKTRGDAEIVLDSMNDIISQYGRVSVSDFYDLAKVPNDNFTMNKYGWTSLSGASAMRIREGYILKLPRAVPLN